jgi:hypothetical protein
MHQFREIYQVTVLESADRLLPRFVTCCQCQPKLPPPLRVAQIVLSSFCTWARVFGAIDGLQGDLLTSVTKRVYVSAWCGGVTESNAKVRVL